MSKKTSPETMPNAAAVAAEAAHRAGVPAQAASPFAAIAATLGDVEGSPALQELPTLASPMRIGDGKSVAVAVDGNSLIIVCNVDPSRIAKLRALPPKIITTGKNAGKPASNVDLAKAGGFAGVAIPGPGGETLSLNLWLGTKRSK